MRRKMGCKEGRKRGEEISRGRKRKREMTTTRMMMMMMMMMMIIIIVTVTNELVIDNIMC